MEGPFLLNYSAVQPDGILTRRFRGLPHAALAVGLSILLALCALALLTTDSRAATPDCSGVVNPYADDDGDYLTNEQECKGRFDAGWWDTDDDGLGDAYEDSDRDNLATHEEFKAGFSPIKADSDASLERPYGDGTRDDFEDTDTDGLDTWEEFRAQATIRTRKSNKNCARENFEEPPGSEPLKPWTSSFDPQEDDSFTLVDGVCTQNGQKLDGQEDIDRDGLTTVAEFDLNWNPNLRDTDHDGVRDGREPGSGDEVGRRHHG